MTQSTTGLVEPRPCAMCGIKLDYCRADDRWTHTDPAGEACFLEFVELLDADDIAAWNTRPTDPTIAELVAALGVVFPPDVQAVMAEMKGDWSIPANQLAADATATSGRDILPARVLKILRALHEFGLAEFGPLYNEDEPKMQGRGYWLSNAGVRAQSALTKSRSAL